MQIKIRLRKSNMLILILQCTIQSGIHYSIHTLKCNVMSFQILLRARLIHISFGIIVFCHGMKIICSSTLFLVETTHDVCIATVVICIWRYELIHLQTT